MSVENSLSATDDNATDENRGDELVGGRYRLIGVIGGGSYGTVYKAVDQCSGSLVACKRFRMPLSDEGLPKHVIREVVLLRHFSQLRESGRHTVKLLDVCVGRPTSTYDQLDILLDYFPTDLFNYLYCSNRERCLPTELRITKQICQALAFLHEHRVIHRDLKPQNVLMDLDARRVRLADFGMSKIWNSCVSTSKSVATLWYRAPELMLSIERLLDEPAIDYWSLHALAFEVFAGEPLFTPPGQIVRNQKISEKEQLFVIFEVIGIPTEDEWYPDSLICYSFVKEQCEKSARNLWDKKKLLLPKGYAEVIMNGLRFDPSSRTDPEGLLKRLEVLSHES